MFEKIAELIDVSDVSDCDHEHPTLKEVGGCIDAWICYHQREDRDDGTVVCGGCGRVLVEDTSAWKHDPENMPSREADDE